MSMRAGNLTAGKKILFIIIIALATLLLAEGIARLASRGPRWFNPYYAEVSAGYPELEALIEDAQYNHPGPKYYDEFLYAAAPYSSTHLNYTDYYSARRTPDSVPLDRAEHIVWTFGGSTMENSETTDSLTLANTWARTFNQVLGPTHVKNFGTGGFISSYELIKFQKLLREVPGQELPTMVIFYDGFNDALFGFQYGPGSLQKDLALKLQALVENDDLSIGIYSFSRWLSERSALWTRTGARVVSYLLFPFPEPDTGEAVLADTVKIYLNNVRITEAICKEYEIRCFFVLQPLIVTKLPLTSLEQAVLDELEAHPRFGVQGSNFIREFYFLTDSELSGVNHFINAAHILDGRELSDFYDLGHVGVETPPVIAEAIAAIILERLSLETSEGH
jgi:hypothetical protein